MSIWDEDNVVIVGDEYKHRFSGKIVEVLAISYNGDRFQVLVQSEDLKNSKWIDKEFFHLEYMKYFGGGLHG